MALFEVENLLEVSDGDIDYVVELSDSCTPYEDICIYQFNKSAVNGMIPSDAIVMSPKVAVKIADKIKQHYIDSVIL